MNSYSIKYGMLKSANRVAILQSNYIPWKGYFDIIHDVDLFIFYDDVQFTKRDWRSRNKVKTIRGTEWLTIPVIGGRGDLIHEVRIADTSWQKNHWMTLVHLYGKSPFFNLYRTFFEDLYLNRIWANLSQLNQYLIQTISCEFLGITTKFSDSRIYEVNGAKQDRIIELLRSCGASSYVSGPAAKDYIDDSFFERIGIELIWKDYGGYPEYSQFYPPFVHGVTILDLLFHAGPNAPWYIWGWRDEK